jgi:hypothetical protein
MLLSEAIRLGAGPQCFGKDDTKAQDPCAMGGTFEGLGIGHYDRHYGRKLKELYPWLFASAYAHCPHCGRKGQTPVQIIIHLNDYHHWTREAVADWVAALEAKLGIQRAEMSDETYYTVLNVKETASPSEIKTAYRDLIKQVHPDTIATAAPHLRRIAEDKTKEIIEAYKVLSDSSKRRDYDGQLGEYRHQNAQQAPPQPTSPPPTQQATSQSSTGPFCNKCGTSLYASGFCPKCNQFAVPVPTPPLAKVVQRQGYNWAWLTGGIPYVLAFFIIGLVSTPKSDMALAFALLVIVAAATFAIRFLIERRNSRARGVPRTAPPGSGIP